MNCVMQAIIQIVALDAKLIRDLLQDVAQGFDVAATNYKVVMIKFLSALQDPVKSNSDIIAKNILHHEHFKILMKTWGSQNSKALNDVKPKQGPKTPSPVPQTKRQHESLTLVCCMLITQHYFMCIIVPLLSMFFLLLFSFSIFAFIRFLFTFKGN